MSVQPIDNIRDPKIVCNVKVIQNPRLPESFDMKTTLYPLRKVDVTIVTPNHAQLGAIVQEMKRTYGMAKFAFRVHFNWINASKEIKNDPHFKADIYNIFSNAPSVKSFVTANQFKQIINGGALPIEINQSNSNVLTITKPNIDKDSLETYVELVRTYVVDYGNHPDWKDRSEKNVKKIHNYIKSVCALPHMPLEISLNIADSI
jgi:hypothetical protein